MRLRECMLQASKMGMVVCYKVHQSREYKHERILDFCNSKACKENKAHWRLHIQFNGIFVICDEDQATYVVFPVRGF